MTFDLILKGGVVVDGTRKAPYPANILDEHSGDVPCLDCRQHFLKAGAFHSSTCNAVVHEKQGISIALFLCGLLEYFLLIADAV